MNGLVYPSLVLSLGLLGFGCSAIVDADRVQCSTNADCTGRGGEFANTMCVKNFCEATDAWSCAKHTPLVAKSSKPISVEFTLFDAVSSKFVDNVHASLCGKLDLECTSPVAEIQTDTTGKVHFDVAPLFEGYVQLRGDGYDPTMMFVPPAVESIDLGQFPLTTMVATSVLTSQLGKPLLPGTGRVLVITTGCDKQTSGGVGLSGENMGDEAETFYAVGGFPSFTADETDESGFAGFVNVAAGSVTLVAKVAKGREVGRVALFVRPDYVSVRRIQPWSD
jgi:hypothetical protein